MPNDITLPQLVLNKMTREQFEEAKAGGAISPTEMYLVDDPEGGGSGNDYIPTPSSASVGQTIRVSAVDENGKPTEWEAVNFPEGGGGSGGGEWDIHYKTNIAEPLAEGFEITEVDGEPLQLKEMWAMVKLQNGADGGQWLGCRILTDNHNIFLSDITANNGGAHVNAGVSCYFIYHAVVIGNGRVVCETSITTNLGSSPSVARATNGDWLGNWLDYNKVQYIKGIKCFNNLGAGTPQGYGTEIEIWGVRA